MNGNLLLKNTSRHLSNLPGWRTNRKIVVIESDDWGSARFPNENTVKAFKKKGYPVEACGFSRYDCLESNDDMERLFDVLAGYHDSKGNHPIVTLLCLTANPDFKKIAESDYQEYFAKSLPETLQEYPQHDRVMDLYKEGLTRKLIRPQFHGREHLYISRWLRDLRQRHPDTMFAFQQGVSGISSRYMPQLSRGYRAAFDLDQLSDLEEHKRTIKKGIAEFNTIYGVSPRYFVAPDGPFHNSLEQVLADHQIKYLGASKIQREPQGDGSTKKHFHWLGKKNRHQQYYITRNVIFEPISSLYLDWAAKVMQDISIAFQWKKPAIISTHRANYTGTIDTKNRDRGLIEFNKLLKFILQKWPEVEFMTSDQLGDLMAKSNHTI